MPVDFQIFLASRPNCVSSSISVVIVSNAHAKVEAPDANGGKSKTNDIGNKENVLGGGESSSNPDHRMVHDKLKRNKFTIERYVRDAKPARKLTPIITTKVSQGYTK